MELRTLGRTGVQVSRFGLGTMVLGAWGNTDHDDCVRLINRAIDAGINLSTPPTSTRSGRARRSSARRSPAGGTTVVLATKFHNAMTPDPNHRGNSRRWINRAVEDSLRRLGTDHIDLYQVHRPDPDDRHLGDDRRAHRPRARRQDRRVGNVDLPRRRPRRGVLERRPPSRGGAAQRAAAVLDHVPRHRGRRAAGLSSTRHRRHRLEPARRADG